MTYIHKRSLTVPLWFFILLILSIKCFVKLLLWPLWDKKGGKNNTNRRFNDPGLRKERLYYNIYNIVSLATALPEIYIQHSVNGQKYDFMLTKITESHHNGDSNSHSLQNCFLLLLSSQRKLKYSTEGKREEHKHSKQGLVGVLQVTQVVKVVNFSNKKRTCPKLFERIVLFFKHICW